MSLLSKPVQAEGRRHRAFFNVSSSAALDQAGRHVAGPLRAMNPAAFSTISRKSVGVARFLFAQKEVDQQDWKCAFVQLDAAQ